MNQNLIKFICRCVNDDNPETELDWITNYTHRVINLCINSLYDSSIQPKNSKESVDIIERRFTRGSNG